MATFAVRTIWRSICRAFLEHSSHGTSPQLRPSRSSLSLAEELRPWHFHQGLHLLAGFLAGALLLVREDPARAVVDLDVIDNIHVLVLSGWSFSSRHTVKTKTAAKLDGCFCKRAKDPCQMQAPKTSILDLFKPHQFRIQSHSALVLHRKKLNRQLATMRIPRSLMPNMTGKCKVTAAVAAPAAAAQEPLRSS